MEKRTPSIAVPKQSDKARDAMLQHAGDPFFATL
jgi:hypothetical protein